MTIDREISDAHYRAETGSAIQKSSIAFAAIGVGALIVAPASLAVTVLATMVGGGALAFGIGAFDKFVTNRRRDAAQSYRSSYDQTHDVLEVSERILADGVASKPLTAFASEIQYMSGRVKAFDAKIEEIDTVIKNMSVEQEDLIGSLSGKPRLDKGNTDIGSPDKPKPSL